MNKSFWNIFWNSCWDGLCDFFPIVAAAIGGMIIMRGASNDEVIDIILGILVVAVSMLVNKLISYLNMN